MGATSKISICSLMQPQWQSAKYHSDSIIPWIWCESDDHELPPKSNVNVLSYHKTK